jgi:ferredoxin, 2Fe-2S
VRNKILELTIFNLDSNETTIEAYSGVTFIDVYRENGFDELTALCGGCCSCATRHVYINGASAYGLPPISEYEIDLLDSSDDRKASSRLSCQITLSDEYNLTVIIAPSS